MINRLISSHLWRRLDEAFSGQAIGIAGAKFGFGFCLGNDYLVITAVRGS